MSTDIKTAGVDPEVLADVDAIMRHMAEGTPVNQELARRCEERGKQITERLRRENVQIDIEKLLRDAGEDA